MHPQQRLFESIFKRNFSDPGNKDFLETVAAAHPYFSPAWFYLLRQTEPGDPSFESSAAKAGLFFNNPLWLNYQLHQAEERTATNESYPPTIIEQQPVVEELMKEESIVEATYEPEPVSQLVEITEEVLLSEDTDETEIITQPVTEQVHMAETVSAEIPVLENTVATESAELQAKVNEPDVSIQQELLTGETPVIEYADVPPAVTIQEEEIQVENPVLERYTETELKPEPEIMNTESKLPEEKNMPEELPLFEPMHMVDYFASQGIKLSEEVQAGDKLGKQLKSFTEWLKTMKKVHATNQLSEGGHPDQSVEAMAEMSNQQNEVITEAMAEVFARQGKTGKAIEVYQKLSLLNPAKSAYFAARIENLKGA